MVISPFSGYNPGAHRMISTILKSIAELDDDQAVPALRKIPRSAREVLRFCYGNHEIDLPTDNIDVTPISPRAFVDESAAILCNVPKTREPQSRAYDLRLERQPSLDTLLQHRLPRKTDPARVLLQFGVSSSKTCRCASPYPSMDSKYDGDRLF